MRRKEKYLKQLLFVSYDIFGLLSSPSNGYWSELIDCVGGWRLTEISWHYSSIAVEIGGDDLSNCSSDTLSD